MKSNFQIGKNGITDNFIANLRIYFDKYRTARISILASGPREDKKKLSEDLLEKLGKKYSCRIIGFVIVVTRWRTNRE